MVTEQELFDIPRAERQRMRRRTRPAQVRRQSPSRRDRIERRNRILTARYYYWTELCRRRFDDALRILSEDEFFIEERTVTNVLVEQDAYYRSLLDSRTTKRQLRRQFVGFDWS